MCLRWSLRPTFPSLTLWCSHYFCAEPLHPCALNLRAARRWPPVTSGMMHWPLVCSPDRLTPSRALGGSTLQEEAVLPHVPGGAGFGVVRVEDGGHGPPRGGSNPCSQTSCCRHTAQCTLVLLISTVTMSGEFHSPLRMCETGSPGQPSRTPQPHPAPGSPASWAPCILGETLFWEAGCPKRCRDGAALLRAALSRPSWGLRATSGQPSHPS